MICGPVSTGLAAAEDIGVVRVEPQQVDGLVALEVGLLVDGEAEGAVLQRRWPPGR